MCNHGIYCICVSCLCACLRVYVRMRTYFTLGSCQFLIAAVLSLARHSFGPDDDSNVDVGEGEYDERQEILKYHHTDGVGIALRFTVRPDLGIQNTHWGKIE